MKLLSTCLFFLFSIISMFAQNEKGHFLVEFDAFSPPTKELIASLENTKASPFLAPDLDGKEQFLGDYAGKNVILWFWSSADGISINQIANLNALQSRYKNNLQIISFADEKKQELIDFSRSNPIDFPIIANGKVLGEAAFGGDLGQGRLIIIDAKGVIQKVLPREAFQENNDGAFKFAEDFIKSI